MNGGPIVDFELNSSETPSIDKQSGIGLGLGFGGAYNFKHFTIY